MNILIVDDEAPARERLIRLLDDLPDVSVAAEAANGRDALLACQGTDVDVVLLDIRIPVMDGIETAGHMAKLEEPPAIIFTTAYDQYAIEAFETEAVGYLLKPVRKERLRLALEKANRLSARSYNALVGQSELSNHARRYVCARIGEELRLIPIHEVSYFEADQKYVKARHSGGADLLDDSLKSLEVEFADTFVRTHRKMLVAIDSIEALEKSPAGMQVRLRGVDEVLPVSRRHIADVRERLKSRR